MPDVEKVVKALEEVIAEAVYPDRPRKFMMPLELAADALALLKAQEPVVMAGAELTDAELIEKIRKAPIVMRPNVDAAPVVHGQWVDEKGNPVPWCDALPSSPAYSCWCNQCGTWLVASDEYPVYGLFCPACGAKMDGERRDEDAAD